MLGMFDEITLTAVILRVPIENVKLRVIDSVRCIRGAVGVGESIRVGLSLRVCVHARICTQPNKSAITSTETVKTSDDDLFTAMMAQARAKSIDV